MRLLHAARMLTYSTTTQLPGVLMLTYSASWALALGTKCLHTLYEVASSTFAIGK